MNVQSVPAATPEDVLSQLQVQLRDAQAARDRAEIALQVRDQFLSVISHELRSPLSGIQSWAYVLERTLGEDAAPTLQRALAGIKTGVQQQVKLIDDLMDATQVMAGRVSLQCQPLAPQSLLDETLSHLQSRLDEKGIQLTQAVQSPLGEVSGDRVRMVQILENIMANAIRFSSQGGTISVAMDDEAGQLRIAVTDSGKGIAAHRLPLLQDPYPQTGADASPSAWQPAGIGLKLALTRRLLELQGGRLSLSSEGEGKGAQFVLHFPFVSMA